MIHSSEMKNSNHSSMKQMTTKIVKYFNTPVLDFLFRIFHKHFKSLICRKKQQQLQQKQNKDSALCAVLKSKAALRILKKYDEECYHGGLVKSGGENRMFECCTDNAVKMMMKSACALELMALQINSKERRAQTKSIPGLFDQCLLLMDDGRPSLSVTLQDSTVLNVDLTCSICLVSVSRYQFKLLINTKHIILIQKMIY